jgi:hypothetical protein
MQWMLVLEKYMHAVGEADTLQCAFILWNGKNGYTFDEELPWVIVVNLDLICICKKFNYVCQRFVINELLSTEMNCH